MGSQKVVDRICPGARSSTACLSGSSTGSPRPWRSSQALDGAAGFYTDTYGSPPELDAGRGLIVDGTTTLDARGGLVNDGSLRLVDTVIEGDVISPASGE